MMKMTLEIAWAISLDRANARMRDGGRTKWNRHDYNHAVAVFNRLWPEGEDLTPSPQPEPDRLP